MDNRLALNAGWDDEMLALELAALKEEQFELDLLGFDEEELERLANAPNDVDREAEEDEAPDAAEISVSQSGDVWLLGDHRVLCGDAQAREAFEQVLQGEVAGLVFTDPPYNVDYAPADRTGHARRIANDNLGTNFGRFLGRVCAHLVSFSSGAIYICMSSSELHTLAQAFRDAGGHWSTFLIWAKDRFTLGRSDYHRQYEPILYGWPEGKSHYWCGDRDQSDVWSVARVPVNDLHPTMKPVALVERAIINSSRRGETVLDAFGGSGTTVIACEKTGRRGRLIEVDPKYVDVIVKRWQKYTGRMATLSGNNETFDEIEEERLGVGSVVQG